MDDKEIQKWAYQASEEERKRIAGDRKTPPEVLSWLLLNDDELFVRSRAADNPSTPTASLEEVTKGPGFQLFWYEIINNPSASISLLERYATPKALICARKELASSPRATEKILEMLFYDDRNEVVNEAIRNPNLPRCLLELAASSDVWRLRRAAACNTNLPEDLIEKLKLDKHTSVRQALASNPSLPESVALELAKEKGERIKENILHNSAISADVIRAMSRDEDMQFDIAQHEKCPSDVLKYLSKKSREIRVCVAENANTNLNTLICLAQDKSYEVREVALSNPNMTEGAKNEIMSNASSDDLYWVSKNPNTSPEKLEILSKNKDFWIRINVADNPNTSAETLSKLAKSNDELIREAVMDNPNTPPEIVDWLKEQEGTYDLEDEAFDDYDEDLDEDD